FCPPSDSLALGSALLASKVRTVARLPRRAASMSGVSPESSPPFGSAPAAKSLCAIAGSACAAAAYSAVAPNSLAPLTSAPARNRRSTISRSLREAAQTSAAVPSVPAMTFCGTPFSKERTASRSPSFAAVASGSGRPVSTANAVPAKIVEPSTAARMVVLMFIAVLPRAAFPFQMIHNAPVRAATAGERPHPRASGIRAADCLRDLTSAARSPFTSEDTDADSTVLSGRQFKPPSAVAQALHMRNIGLVQHGEEQIGHWRPLGILDVTSALDPVDAAGDQQERQVGIEVQIGVAQRSAVHDHRVIEQRTVAVRRGAQLVEVISQHLRMEDVDLDGLLDLLRVALVMRAGMMGIAKSDLRIGAAAHLMAHHERDDARHVGLPGQNHEIGHQLEVLGEHFRRAGGPCNLRHLDIALFLRELHASLDIAHSFQILVDLAAIGSAELDAQPFDVRVDGVKDAALLLPQRQANLR